MVDLNAQGLEEFGHLLFLTLPQEEFFGHLQQVGGGLYPFIAPAFHNG